MGIVTAKPASLAFNRLFTATGRGAWACLCFAKLLLHRLGVGFGRVSLRLGGTYLGAKIRSCRPFNPASNLLAARCRGKMCRLRRGDGGTAGYAGGQCEHREQWANR